MMVEWTAPASEIAMDFEMVKCLDILLVVGKETLTGLWLGHYLVIERDLVMVLLSA